MIKISSPIQRLNRNKFQNSFGGIIWYFSQRILALPTIRLAILTPGKLAPQSLDILFSQNKKKHTKIEDVKEVSKHSSGIVN